MKYIILIGDETFTLDSIKAIHHYDSVRNYDVDETRYCVEYSTEHIFYDFHPDIISYYEEFELLRIPFDNPNFITMVYKTEFRMREILQQDNFIRNFYVDNDFDLIVPVEEFIRLGMPI